MEEHEVLVLGTNQQVAAYRKRDGVELWRTKLGGWRGDDFVTLLVEENSVYVHTKGRLYCLDLRTGKEAWSNELQGLGYETGMLAVHGASTQPAAAVHQKQKRDEEAAAAAGG